MKNKFKLIVTYICLFLGMMLTFLAGCMLDSGTLFVPTMICFVGFVFLGIAIIINRREWL